jgi:tetratricopeptide (TPR) repeat protein
MAIEPEKVGGIAAQLIDVGMAQPMDYDYLRLDPALPAYLKRGQKAEDLTRWGDIWVEAMAELVDFLYEQRSQDTKMAAQLTLLELPNLLALLDTLQEQLEADTSKAERVSDVAGSVEHLLVNLGKPQALAKAVALRELASSLITNWGHASFNSERLLIERLLQQGQLQGAFDKAEALLEKAKAVGVNAYEGADYDLVMAHNLLCNALRYVGQSTQALELLSQAQVLCEALGQQGERMASVVLGEQADCLVDLGQLDEAADKYQESIKRAEKQQDSRRLAVGKAKLASVFYLQGKYVEAIKDYEEARTIFEQQNEPAGVATAWHQLGMVHQDAGNHEKAEAAYRQSLEIRTQNNILAGQADSLGELGNLYDGCLNRSEEAVSFYRQAVDIYVELGDLSKEGVVRSNIADTLVKLEHYDEARTAINRAIVCKSQFGHVAEPWKSFSILRKVEVAVGNNKAANSAWLKARDAYLAYRQQGGYAQSNPGKLINVILAVNQEDRPELIKQLTELTQTEDIPDWLKFFIPKVITIIKGSKDSTLADDSTLNYDEAAELLFLLERFC